MQKCCFANARQPQRQHHETRQPQAETAVWRTPIAKEIEIVRDRLTKSRRLRLTSQHIGAMLPLRSSRDLHALPHQVEALRHQRIVLVAHMVERTEQRWIVGEKQKLAAMRVESPAREHTFARRIDVARLRCLRNPMTLATK